MPNDRNLSSEERLKRLRGRLQILVDQIRETP
jgi:hypothetical protein